VSPEGYTLPLSPGGGASYVSPPPWRFDGDLMWVSFVASSSQVLPYLPSELEPEGEETRLAAAFCRWRYSEPESSRSSPFHEYFVMAACTYRGRPVGRCLGAWVDDPRSLVRGWIQGIPKCYGRIEMTGDDGRYEATLGVEGDERARAAMTRREQVDEPPELARLDWINTRVFPGFAREGASVLEHVRSVVRDQTWTDVYRADEVAFAQHEKLLAGLDATDVRGAYVFRYTETITSGALLA
jgi:hypothetical protein